MTNKKDFIEHFKLGRSTLYDEKKHIELLHDIFANGESIYAFCDEALIARRTFYYWLATHEKFKEAYDVALCAGARQFEKYPQLNPENFNFPYWSTVMKNRYQYYKTRIETKPNDTPRNRIEAVWEGVSSGQLSTQEASQLASLAVTQANIENGTTEDKGDNVRHLTTNELKERLNTIDDLIGKSAG